MHLYPGASVNNFYSRQYWPRSTDIELIFWLKKHILQKVYYESVPPYGITTKNNQLYMSDRKQKLLIRAQGC